jgi:hypothetical protein
MAARGSGCTVDADARKTEFFVAGAPAYASAIRSIRNVLPGTWDPGDNPQLVSRVRVGKRAALGGHPLATAGRARP